MYLPLISITKLLKSFYFSSEVNNDCSSLESSVSTLEETVSSLSLGESEDYDMNIYEYLDAIYSNTGGSEAVSGVATIASAIKVATISSVTSLTVDISSYIGNYTDLTADNFVLDITYVNGLNLNYWADISLSIGAITITKTYDSESGTLTISPLRIGVYNGNSGYLYLRGSVYLIGTNIDIISS